MSVHPQRTRFRIQERPHYEIYADRRRRQPGPRRDLRHVAGACRADPRHDAQVLQTPAPRRRPRAGLDGTPGTARLLDGAGASNPCNIGSLAGGTGCGLNPAAVGAATQSGQAIAGNFTLGESGTGFQAWGNGDGTADLSYGFDGTGGALYDFRMLGEFTDDWNINEIGW